MKRRKLIVAAVVGCLALAFMAAPALAHNNLKSNAGAARNVVVVFETGGEAAIPGFIGPVREQVGDEIYIRAHSGMECGAANSPNIGSLAGNPAFPPFACPSPNKP